ncbi:MAG: ABC transporter ATP-binding protein [Granulosicoccus sp.]
MTVSEEPLTAISVDGLGHAYTSGQTRTQILDGASLRVNAGQTIALIGRSGSGKSTLLNLISGLEPISTGDVILNGKSMKRLNDHQRTLLRGKQIGFIYQAFNLIPTLSVNDNIALPLALAGEAYAKRTQRIEQLLSAVGLEGRANDYPDRLSGGEQQRVAIARALVHKPALILADEPTGNLDAKSGRQVLQLLTDLVKNQRSAMLLVTHSMEVARSADSILVLDQGKVDELQGNALEKSAAW